MQTCPSLTCLVLAYKKYGCRLSQNLELAPLIHQHGHLKPFILFHSYRLYHTYWKNKYGIVHFLSKGLWVKKKSIKWCISVPEDCFYLKQTVKTLMKCRLMRHFNWVFTVKNLFTGIQNEHGWRRLLYICDKYMYKNLMCWPNYSYGEGSEL